MLKPEEELEMFVLSEKLISLANQLVFNVVTHDPRSFTLISLLS